MNIFFLSKDVNEAARWMVDKHVVKMPTESAQMLSTAHRILDGEFVRYEYWNERDTTSVRKMWILEGEEIRMGVVNDKFKPVYFHSRGFTLYSPTHVMHPSTQWTMSGCQQYEWHFKLLRAMLSEYTYRYGKIHSVEKLLPLLAVPPKNMVECDWTEPALAMPDEYKSDNHVAAYQAFYVGEKSHIAKWKNRPQPEWYK